MQITITDGGRRAAGYKGEARDCVTRAVAIATSKPYQEIYDMVQSTQRTERRPKNGSGPSSPRPWSGVRKDTTKRLMASLGWHWTPTMGIGTGCRVHLRDGELPMGRLVVSVSKHLVAVIDGVVHDSNDPTRGGTRCVYGYWTFNNKGA